MCHESESMSSSVLWWAHVSLCASDMCSSGSEEGGGVGRKRTSFPDKQPEASTAEVDEE